MSNEIPRQHHNAEWVEKPEFGHEPVFKQLQCKLCGGVFYGMGKKSVDEGYCYPFLLKETK